MISCFSDSQSWIDRYWGPCYHMREHWYLKTHCKGQQIRPPYPPHQGPNMLQDLRRGREHSQGRGSLDPQAQCTCSARNPCGLAMNSSCMGDGRACTAARLIPGWGEVAHADGLQKVLLEVHQCAYAVQYRISRDRSVHPPLPQAAIQGPTMHLPM